MVQGVLLPPVRSTALISLCVSVGLPACRHTRPGSRTPHPIICVTPQPADFRVLCKCPASRCSAESHGRADGVPSARCPVQRVCCAWLGGLCPPHRFSVRLFSILFCCKRHRLGCKICQQFALKTPLSPAYCGSSVTFLRLCQSKFQEENQAQGFERLTACSFF